MYKPVLWSEQEHGKIIGQTCPFTGCVCKPEVYDEKCKYPSMACDIAHEFTETVSVTEKGEFVVMGRSGKYYLMTEPVDLVTIEDIKSMKRIREREKFVRRLATRTYA